MRSIKERNARYLAEMRADPSDPRHGKVGGYSYGCRCERCRAVYSEYMRARLEQNRKKRLKEMQDNPHHPKHGTMAGYQYGCRCEDCKKANSELKKRDYAKRKAKKPKATKAKGAKAERAARWKAELEASYGERERRSERVRALVAGGEGRWRRMTE